MDSEKDAHALIIFPLWLNLLKKGKKRISQFSLDLLSMERPSIKWIAINFGALWLKGTSAKPDKSSTKLIPWNSNNNYYLSLYHLFLLPFRLESKGKEKKMIKTISINQRVRQGCSLSPTLFSSYIDDIIRRWQIELKDKFYINNIEINTLLFADDQVILTNSKDNL
jgi:hypothetical protein